VANNYFSVREGWEREREREKSFIAGDPQPQLSLIMGKDPSSKAVEQDRGARQRSRQSMWFDFPCFGLLDWQAVGRNERNKGKSDLGRLREKPKCPLLLNKEPLSAATKISVWRRS
jgi:hypothetical protein